MNIRILSTAIAGAALAIALPATAQQAGQTTPTTPPTTSMPDTTAQPAPTAPPESSAPAPAPESATTPNSAPEASTIAPTDDASADTAKKKKKKH